jgi:hypothetical protein
VVRGIFAEWAGRLAALRKDHIAVSHVHDHKGDYKELSVAEGLIKGELPIVDQEFGQFQT